MYNAVIILQLLATYGPAVAETAHAILTANDPTPADWERLFELSKKPYDSFIADAQKRAAARTV